MILAALEEAQVWFVVIGGLTRVLQGSDEVTRGVDITPSPQPRNLERLVAALEGLGASPASGVRLERALADPERQTPLRLVSPAGEILVVHRPAGTQGLRGPAAQGEPSAHRQGAAAPGGRAG